jgi:hypothetical protein
MENQVGISEINSGKNSVKMETLGLRVGILEALWDQQFLIVFQARLFKKQGCRITFSKRGFNIIWELQDRTSESGDRQ